MDAINLVMVIAGSIGAQGVMIAAAVTVVPSVSFTFQLCIGTVVAFAVCVAPAKPALDRALKS